MADDPTLYVQVDELKSSLSLDDFDDADDDLLVACTAASRGIDEMTERRFYRLDRSNDEVRTYTPEGPLLCRIDDLLALTAAEVDGDGDGVYETEIVRGADFIFEPQNAQADGRPWERIIMRNHRADLMPVGVPAGVRITGRFGWEAPPIQVVTAAKMLASQLFQEFRDGLASGTVGAEVAAKVGSADGDIYGLIRRFDRSTRVFG